MMVNKTRSGFAQAPLAKRGLAKTGLAKTALTTAALATLALTTGCNDSQSPAAQGDAAPAQVADNGRVIRETPGAPPATMAPMEPQQVLQSQPGPRGAQVDLLKVAVTGDILTVTLRCKGTEQYRSEAFRLSDVSVIDDSTSQRIAVLKDNDGNWLASNVSGNNMMADCTVRPGIFWAKFAAPSPEAQTVSINFPKIAPFDGIPITR